MQSNTQNQEIDNNTPLQKIIVSLLRGFFILLRMVFIEVINGVSNLVKLIITPVSLYLSNTDADTLRVSSPRAKITQQVKGITILLSTFVSALSMVYFAYTASDNFTISLLAGAIWWAILAHIDKALFLTKGGIALLVRSSLVAAFAVLLALPFEIQLFSESIDHNIEKAKNAKNATLHTPQIELDANYKADKNAANQQLQPILNELTKFRQLREAEDSGVKHNSSSTGKKGRGKMWFYYNNQIQILEKQENELKQQLAQLNKDYTIQKETIESQAILKKEDIKIRFLDRYIELERLTHNDDPAISKATYKLSWYIFIVFILIELLPIILKILTEETDYDLRVERRKQLELKKNELIMMVHDLQHQRATRYQKSLEESSDSDDSFEDFYTETMDLNVLGDFIEDQFVEGQFRQTTSPNNNSNSQSNLKMATSSSRGGE